LASISPWIVLHLNLSNAGVDFAELGQEFSIDHSSRRGELIEAYLFQNTAAKQFKGAVEIPDFDLQ